jgi:hypothetical protein
MIARNTRIRIPVVTTLDLTGERPLGAGVFGKAYTIAPTTKERYGCPSVTATCPYCQTQTSGKAMPGRCLGCYAQLTATGARRPDKETLRRIRPADPRRLLWQLCDGCGQPGANDKACPKKVALLGDSRPCSCCPACRKRCEESCK